jgi:hypothetical protein
MSSTITVLSRPKDRGTLKETGLEPRGCRWERTVEPTVAFTTAVPASGTVGPSKGAAVYKKE